MASILQRVQRGWNAFRNSQNPNDPHNNPNWMGNASYSRPDRTRYRSGHERSIVWAAYNRIAVDVASVDIRHVQLDENGRYKSTIQSGLNTCLTLEANLDQTGREFIQDLVISMFDEGCIAAVPIDCDENPDETGSYDVETIRVGKIMQWYPQYVKVRLYNERTGKQEDVIVPKARAAIIPNPFYEVMNQPNSTLQRLIRKLNLLDAIDEQSGSGKLDLIIQLPYTVKTEQKRQQAENRRKNIEMQLTGTKYGIAYIDSTEHVTQLNRSIDNNLMKQIEYLTSMLYSQLGLTEELFNGTADEATMLNYDNRTIEPILSQITDNMKRKFLTKNARTRGQSIEFFRDPFRLVPVSQLADIADKLTRNEIASSNEIRTLIGWKPVDDPKADELRNKNLNQSTEAEAGNVGVPTVTTDTP